MELGHLDEHGLVCTRHAIGNSGAVLELALVGSRAPSFHHDLASKLQGLMMAIDEIGELAETAEAPLRRAIETAESSLREVLGLLSANRAITKVPAKTRTTLAEVITRAAERVYVNLGAAIPSANLDVAVPSLTHALALVVDVAGGPGRGRTLDARIAIEHGVATITLPASTEPPPNAAESLALASFVLDREGGSLRCAAEGTRLVVRLPVV